MKVTNGEKAFFVFAAIVDINLLSFFLLSLGDPSGGDALMFALPLILVATILSPVFILRALRRLRFSFAWADMFALTAYSIPLIFIAFALVFGR